MTWCNHQNPKIGVVLKQQNIWIFSSYVLQDTDILLDTFYWSISVYICTGWKTLLLFPVQMLEYKTICNNITSVKNLYLNIQSLFWVRLAQLCPTQMAYRAKNHATVLTRAAHWMTY